MLTSEQPSGHGQQEKGVEVKSKHTIAGRAVRLLTDDEADMMPRSSVLLEYEKKS